MKRVKLYLVLLLCLLVSATALAKDPKSPIESYLEELHDQGLERVVVIFKDEVDASLVEKYNGNLIRVFTTVKALICEIPLENIELLELEESVKGVAPDVVIKPQWAGEQRDPEELAEFLRLKKEYFSRIRGEYVTAIREAREEYLSFTRKYLPMRRMITRYARIIGYYRRAGRTNSPGYRYFILRYSKLLRTYYEAYYRGSREALQVYRAKLVQARSVYLHAISGWEEKVNEKLAKLYDGPVEVRWNNLEAGLNAQAAWDNHNLDGTGIKIAFLDTGINYTLEDLDDNYLGGYDFVNDDDDPMPVLDGAEDHGTMVASLAVGEGVNKVVGAAYNAGYYSVKTSATDISGNFVSDVISGIEWASTEPHKADIISMSFGTYGTSGFWKIYWKPLFRDACDAAYDAGVILVAGSGNKGYTYCLWPARFDNVISVGAHTIDQTVASFSNGGVDIVTPGGDGDRITPEDNLYMVAADNSTWWGWGTSFATPHAAALIALQLQYARQNNIDVNNGYLWEVMKHAAWPLTGEPYDPVYQGKGKIWATETNTPPADPHDGSIDLMSSSTWPFDYNFSYYNEICWDTIDGYYVPVFFIGRSMYQDITLTNNTDTLGNTPEYIENLNVTTTQKYRATGDLLPGAPTEDFGPMTIDPGYDTVLQDTYYIPWSASPGLYNVVLDLEFNFAGNSRVIKITDNEASIWCPPEIINEDFPEKRGRATFKKRERTKKGERATLKVSNNSDSHR